MWCVDRYCGSRRNLSLQMCFWVKDWKTGVKFVSDLLADPFNRTNIIKNYRQERLIA